jgi:class 3 adenylate cyclase
MNPQEQALQAAIAVLEQQRAVIGDELVDKALAPLREQLAAAARPADLERRLVTVLFADIVGSTAIVQKLDEEDALDVMGGALEQLATIVQAHGGHVLRFTGDGFKAAFGDAQAREDDAARALLAGLAMLRSSQAYAAQMLRRFGIADFALRIGAHTGLVAVGAGFEDGRTAVGAAVHIAARMEQSAPVGGLRISHETFNHVRGLFNVDAQPPIEVKGVDEPLRTSLVLGPRPRDAAAVA